jgi:DNA repair exonuclease SbcCD ATPase subunit
MPNAVNETPAADQEIDARLAVVQEAVSTLANPIPILEDIEAELDILNEEAADPEALNAIHTNAITLLDAQQRLATAFMTTLELAKALKDQREQARQTLAELKRAIEECDIENPDVEALAESIREEQDEMLWYTLDDMLADNIAQNSALTYVEANDLLCLLTGEIDTDHYLWDELRDWMRRASEYTRTGITPPAAAN